MGVVVYAFPATGKTFLCKKNKNCIELTSEKYHWADQNINENNKGLYHNVNENWPTNYLRAIEYYKEIYDYVFITHSGSVLCKENNIPYDLIYPSVECKEEYISRMIKRGNNIEFIKNMEDHFKQYIESLDNDDYPKEKVKLNYGEFLEDGIKKLEEIKKSPLFDYFSSSKQLITPTNSSNIYKKRTREILNDKTNYAIINFNEDYNTRLINNNVGQEVGRFYSGGDYHKIVLLDNLIIVSSFLGGPNAAALMEELSYYGIKNFLAIGTACNIGYNNSNCMLVEKAIRDEGTSLFYKEPSLYSYSSTWLNSMIEEELCNAKKSFYKGVTWTVDAYYRENIDRMKKRITQGASAIDMESSVWCSVAESLNLNFSQLLFFTDCVSNDKWFKNIHNSDIKDEMSSFGIELSKRLIKRIGDKNEYRI